MGAEEISTTALFGQTGMQRRVSQVKCDNAEYSIIYDKCHQSIKFIPEGIPDEGGRREIEAYQLDPTPEQQMCSPM